MADLKKLISNLTDVPALVITLDKYLSGSTNRLQTELGTVEIKRLLELLSKPTGTNIPRLYEVHVAKLIPLIVFVEEKAGQILTLQNALGEYIWKTS